MKLKVKCLVMMGIMMAMASFSLKSEPVDTTMAKMAAYNFFRSISAENYRSQAEPVIVYRAHGMRQVGEHQEDRDYYYIVNLGNEGFVIVAADSRVTPILAYSTSSIFEGQQLPPNMAFLLGEYQEQMDEIDRQQIGTTFPVSAEWEKLRHPQRNHTRDIVVSPLITSKWSQFPYYNALCPVEPRSASGHASAGCTAVAMGQILRYWRYPEHGTGNHSYVANFSYMGEGYGDYGTLSADFGNTNYDYDNMPDSLTANSTSAEVNAVATLLYHCGVSINTAYGVTNSSADFAGVDEALMEYFNYETPMHVYRSVYSQSSWLNMMKTELNHLRPIFYTGAGSLSIHAFVCDGYDDQDYFHINWGWGGNADGYFLLSNLNPQLYTFNTAQTAIIGVEVEPQVMTLSEEELTFFMEEQTPSEVRHFEVQTLNVDSAIHVTATGNFVVSSNTMYFANSMVLPSTGGTVYVQYLPTQQDAHSEVGKVTLVGGACRDTVRLVGVTYYPQCTSPLNFIAVQGDIDTDTNQVLLTWQAPVPDVSDLTWDTVPQAAIGDDEDYTIVPMHRFSIADLLPYHKHRLTHIAFIADSLVSEYRLLVYTGGRITEHGRVLDPGTLVHEQQVDLSSLTWGVWNTIALDSAIVIDGSRELWYGLSISAPANTETVLTGSTESVPFTGDIYGYLMDSVVSWYPYSRNFIMKAVVDNPLVQYEVYRDGDSLAVSVQGTVYADYPPVYAYYLYEVRAVWNDQCAEGAFQMVDFKAPCHTAYTDDFVSACDSLRWIDGVLYTESISGPEMLYTTAQGCDSIVTLKLTMSYTSYVVDSVESTEPYTWIDGITYSESTDEPVVILTSEAGCDSVVNLHLVITVGVANHATEEVLVYPNPTKDEVRVRLPQELYGAFLEMRVYDVYGRVLLWQHVQGDDPVLDLSSYSQGLYVIQLYHQQQLVGTAKISKLKN